MKAYRSVEDIDVARIRHPVVTLGVFDGVHIGHRYVLRECMRLAAERAGESVVVTFGRHPRALIAGRAPQVITSIPHRLSLFEELGVDHCLVLEFDEDLRKMEAETFARRVFVEAIGAELVILGHNCRFGRGRSGGYDFLVEHADDYAFETRECPEIRIGDQNVSSTDIRRAILDGDLDRAASMLGRPYSIWGTVVEGHRRGRTIGFPTANLDLHHELRPPRGVYGCRVDVDGTTYDALTNIGVRPTFAKPETWEDRDRNESIEVHLLEFEGDLYGRDLEVTFLDRIRSERRFESVDALVAQIGRDRETFLAYLRDPNSPTSSGEPGH